MGDTAAARPSISSGPRQIYQKMPKRALQQSPRYIDPLLNLVGSFWLLMGSLAVSWINESSFVSKGSVQQTQQKYAGHEKGVPDLPTLFNRYLITIPGGVSSCQLAG